MNTFTCLRHPDRRSTHCRWRPSFVRRLWLRDRAATVAFGSGHACSSTPSTVSSVAHPARRRTAFRMQSIAALRPTRPSPRTQINRNTHFAQRPKVHRRAPIAVLAGVGFGPPGSRAHASANAIRLPPITRTHTHRNRRSRRPISRRHRTKSAVPSTARPPIHYRGSDRHRPGWRPGRVFSRSTRSHNRPNGSRLPPPPRPARRT